MLSSSGDALSIYIGTRQPTVRIPLHDGETPLLSNRRGPPKHRNVGHCGAAPVTSADFWKFWVVRGPSWQAYLSYHANCAAAPTDAKGQFRKAVQTRCIRVTPEFGRNLAFNAKSRLV